MGSNPAEPVFSTGGYPPLKKVFVPPLITFENSNALGGFCQLRVFFIVVAVILVGFYESAFGYEFPFIAI